ncbi:MAG: restriction endonuclease [Pseudomonadota bacterium]
MEASKEAELKNDDLVVDRIYEGGRAGNASDDPLPPLVGVSNQGGFRYIGNRDRPRLVVLTSTMKDVDWPDNLDRESGIFTYFGDNKKPGHELHDTKRFGNRLLRDLFDRKHLSAEGRREVPPVLLFANTGAWRDVQFLGLAVPGVENLDANSDLVAVWKLKDGRRFQNYQAKFTVLHDQTISKGWIADALSGEPLSERCPESWRRWVETGVYRALKAPRVIEHRTREEQLPADDFGTRVIAAIQSRFADAPVRFETCAAKIAELMMPQIVSMDITRPTRDGGRDAVGRYRVGDGASAVLVDFALEAKCYGAENSVGVKELSRLISRLRHRQFGVLVTTSYVSLQAYQEIKEDQHPIVIVAGADIVRLLQTAGINTDQLLMDWLEDF